MCVRGGYAIKVNKPLTGAKMGTSYLIRFAAVSALAIGLSGCAGLSAFRNRYGPDPVLVATSIEEANANTERVILALEGRAGVGHLPPVDPRWQLVTEAGANYIDEVCDAYLRDLFIFNREINRTKDLITLVGTTTTAIMGFADASKTAIEIATSAFGFGASATSIIGNSYLYRVDPGVIKGIVEKSQKAYRVDYLQDPSSAIGTRPGMYAALHGYLALCLPQTIDRQINEYLANAGAKPSNPGEKPVAAIVAPVARAPLVLRSPPAAAVAPRARIVLRKAVRAPQILVPAAPVSRVPPRIELF